VSRVYKLIVTDTSPLITLAVANELDVLLRARVPIEIPDAVYIEATRVRTAPGANQIGAWINDHSDLVRIVPTETGVDQQRRLEEGRPIRGMGEQASIETLDIFLAKNPDAQALLLFEDSDISKRRAIVDERVSLISTGDFLRELQNAHLIQSAEHILDEAARGGRNVEKQRKPATDVEARETLRRQLQDRHRDSPGMKR
jgi:predicted nucleic acid-binding protein